MPEGSGPQPWASSCSWTTTPRSLHCHLRWPGFLGVEVHCTTLSILFGTSCLEIRFPSLIWRCLGLQATHLVVGFPQNLKVVSCKAGPPICQATVCVHKRWSDSFPRFSGRALLGQGGLGKDDALDLRAGEATAPQNSPTRRGNCWPFLCYRTKLCSEKACVCVCAHVHACF